MPAQGNRKDPYSAFRFLVEIEGLIVGGFEEVAGLDMEIEVESYREGGQNAYVHQLPGAARYPSRLKLKRGLTDADSLWQWYRDVARGRIERRNGSIVLLQAGGEAWRWNFTEAYPVQWQGPALDAVRSELATECVELVHRGLTRSR
jgi:phage tail-like protein